MSDEHAQRQSALIEAVGDTYAEACPGSGKTWVILERYLRRSHEETRKGVALVSFTNAAIDEIRRRAKADVQLLKSPNFVGTFDAFLHRFIVTPGYLMRFGKRPRYCESWSQLELHEVRDKKASLSLDDFIFDANGNAQINWNRVSNQNRSSITASQSALEKMATSRFNSLVSGGLLSSDFARQLAKSFLLDPKIGPVIRRHITGRFAEMMVDEGQDCGEEEIAILTSLHSEGVVIFFVADPDQAIFEFRRSTPQLVADFTATLPPAARLDGNRRCSPAICSIANSLRAGNHADQAIGASKDYAQPVFLIVAGKPDVIRDQFRSLLNRLGISPEGSIVLAHSKSRAYKVAGVAAESTHSDSKLLRMADAVAVLRSQPLPRARRQAIHQLEKAVARAFSYELDKHTIENACDDGLIDARWLRRAAYQLATTVRDPVKVTARQFQEDVIKALGEVDQPAGTVRVSVGQKWPIPHGAKVWNSLGSAQGIGDGSSFKASTIHGVKGMEFSSVLLALPSQLLKDDEGWTVLDDWEKNRNSEPKRVLYVGATRAQLVLALAVSPAQAEKVSSILKRDGVPMQRVDGKATDV
jgi:DNA helicase-2/ATP-dependent DNA helicase PcrA